MIIIIAIFDVLTLIRLPAAICSLMSTRGLRCYYKFRVLTFFSLLLAAIALFAYLCYENIQEQLSAATIICSGVAEGAFIVIDHFANKFLKRYLLRQLRRDQVHLAKLKGQQLKQKAHKGGAVRIDTPPPFVRSDARSIGSRSNRIGHGMSMSVGNLALPSSRDQSQRFNYSRTKTMHVAKSDSSINNFSSDDAAARLEELKQ